MPVFDIVIHVEQAHLETQIRTDAPGWLIEGLEKGGEPISIEIRYGNGVRIVRLDRKK